MQTRTSGPDVSLDPDCDFCAIVAKEEPAREVLRDENVVAFFPTEPATLGHTLIVPRDHIADIWSLTDDAATHLTRATLLLARAISETLNIDGLNIIQSNGEAASQTVMHLHVHVVPRYLDDTMGEIWPKETDWSEAAKTAAQRDVRAGVQAMLGRSER